MSQVSSKKSTRSTTPVSLPPQESQPEATPAPRARTATPAAKAKAAPVETTVAAPESAPVVKPGAKPAAKAKAKPAAASAAKPKPAAAPRAARGRTSPAVVPPAQEQPIGPAPAVAAAIVEAPASEVVRVVTDEDIRIRAYFLSIEHRARGGSDIDFWLIAERELRHGIKAKG